MGEHLFTSAEDQIISKLDRIDRLLFEGNGQPSIVSRLVRLEVCVTGLVFVSATLIGAYIYKLV